MRKLYAIVAGIILLSGGILYMVWTHFVSEAAVVRGPIEWESPVTVNNIEPFEDAGQDARSISPGRFGSEYARLLKLKNGSWLAVYTIYMNNGYLADPKGGTQLQVAISRDDCKSWSPVATLTDPGRDLDNGQMIQLKNGNILLACRSVRWQESYSLPVYQSKDMGKTWEPWSSIDENTGKPGELGFPDKGIYEPHFCMLEDGSVSVMYANEKHVVETPSYSQIISQKISRDDGKTWGKEIFVAWDTERAESRPGMPVWTKMKNGKYIVCYEVVGTENVDVFYKISDDGKTWTPGIGKRIDGQRGGPYILAMTDGRLVVTSNTHQISVSDDNGETWYLELKSPFGSLFDGEDNIWPSLYQINENTIAAVTSAGRRSAGIGGHSVGLVYGTWNNKKAEVKSGSSYWFISKATNCCLQAEEGDAAIKFRIADFKDVSQKWTVEKLPGGEYKISDPMNRVLTLADKNPDKGIMVNLQVWADKPEQKWKIRHIGGGMYSISSVLNGKAISADNQNADGNAVIKLTDYKGEPGQRWELHFEDD